MYIYIYNIAGFSRDMVELFETYSIFLMIMIVGQYHPQSTAIQKLTSKKQ